MVKWAKISRQKKRISIELLRTFPVSEENSFPFPQSSAEEHPYELISGLDSSEVLLRNIQLKLQDRKKIIKSLPFQIEPSLPCPPEEAIVSIQISPGDLPKSSKISFYATKKVALQQHIDFLKQKGAEPDEVSCVPSALWRFSEHFFPHLSNTLILHVGCKTSTIIGIIDKKPSFSHSFSLGSEPFFTALETEGADFSSLDLLNLCKETHPLFYQLTQQAQKELDRVLTFVLKKQKKPWLNIVLTGNFSAFPPLKTFITHHLPETMQLNECSGEMSYDATTLEAYAVAVGFALDGIAQDGCSTKFRQKMFTAPSQKKQKIKLFSSYALSCLVLTSTTLLISHMYRDHKEKTLIENFQSSFSLQNKKIDTLDDLEKEVSLLETSLRKEKVPYSLSLPLPNISEVLAWISSHPVLNSKDSLDDTSEVDMKKVKYNLLKYPKLTATNLPYTAKIELEIEIPNAELAKTFQESLQKEGSFVDLKKEISWQTKGSTYYISFFLKPYLGRGNP